MSYAMPQDNSGAGGLMTFPFDCITDLIFAEPHLEPSDVILVAGGSQPQLAQEAAKLYQQGLAPYVLFSGGANVRLPTYSDECDFLSQIALSLGVPEEAILREPSPKVGRRASGSRG